MLVTRQLTEAIDLHSRKKYYWRQWLSSAVWLPTFFSVKHKRCFKATCTGLEQLNFWVNYPFKLSILHIQWMWSTPTFKLCQEQSDHDMISNNACYARCKRGQISATMNEAYSDHCSELSVQQVDHLQHGFHTPLRPIRYPLHLRGHVCWFEAC